jgi:hypothetical protein
MNTTLHTLALLARQTTPATETNALTYAALAAVIIVAVLIVAIVLRVYAERRATPADVGKYQHEPPTEVPLWGIHLLFTYAQAYAPEHTARALVAVMLDLMRQGVLRVEADANNNPEHILIHRVQPGQPSNAHDQHHHMHDMVEEAVLHFLFPGEQPVRTLEEIVTEDAPHLKNVREQFAATSKQDDFIKAGAVAQHDGLRTAGLVIIGMGVLIPILIFTFTTFARIELGGTWVALLYTLTPASLFALGILCIAASWFIRTRTPAGEQVAARCTAFRRHLEATDQSEQRQTAVANWQRNLPYALVFGIEQPFIIALASTDTPAPAWYTLHRRTSSDLRQQASSESHVATLQEVGISLLGLVETLVAVTQSIAAQPVGSPITPAKPSTSSASTPTNTKGTSPTIASSSTANTGQPDSHAQHNDSSPAEAHQERTTENS